MKLFVASSSCSQIPKKYIDDCNIYLNKLFLEEHDLVFGACNQGIMGSSYNAALINHRSITGVCPQIYKDDFKDLQCQKEITTNSISERMDALISECDAIIILPGGVGTIYELFAALEYKRSHEFDKPIVIYNSCNYFDKLLTFLEQIYSEGFTSKSVSDYYHISTSVEDTLDYLNKYYQDRGLKLKGI